MVRAVRLDLRDRPQRVAWLGASGPDPHGTAELWEAQTVNAPPWPTATLGDRLRYHRLAAGLTGGDVAAAMEVSAGTVSRWESDKTEITIVKLRQLARVLGIGDYWNLLRKLP